jgi:hypothetical protein
MYIVVSKWEVLPGKQEAFEAAGRMMRDLMRSLPGVEYVQGLKSEDGNAVAIVGYTDENSYHAVMADGGEFEKAARENNLESIGKWLWSERGEAVDLEPAMA